MTDAQRTMESRGRARSALFFPRKESMTPMKSARWLRRTAGAAVALCALLPAGAAEAALIQTGACDDAALSTPFAPWGDHAPYKLAPGGDFEGAHGWQLTGGAKVVSGS